MTLDRYTKVALTVIALALLAIALDPLRPLLRAVLGPDAASAQTATAKYEVTVPRAWGKVVNYSNNNLLLEAPDQTLRIVDVEGRPPEFPKVKVLIRWQ